MCPCVCCPAALQFNQYWQLYSNHKLYNGTGDRGFWLVQPNRRETPIWTSMKVRLGQVS